jgi:menaquinone-specific isochorismate synthase
MDRGRYTGPVGWIDASGDGEWGIALRCAEIVPDDGPAEGAPADDGAGPAASSSRGSRTLRLFAGCGIVAGSDPSAELAESDAKLVPMRDALAAG